MTESYSCERHDELLSNTYLGRPGYQAGSAGTGHAVKCAAKESSEKSCFQDKMCVKVKCSKCQKTTWKGKHVINILSLPCGRVLAGRYMSIISIVDKSRSLSIKFDTNQ